MNDSELRKLIRKELNGEYATKICRNCHAYWCSPKGHVDTAIICDPCRECFDRKQNGET